MSFRIKWGSLKLRRLQDRCHSFQNKLKKEEQQYFPLKFISKRNIKRLGGKGA